MTLITMTMITVILTTMTIIMIYNDLQPLDRQDGVVPGHVVRQSQPMVHPLLGEEYVSSVGLKWKKFSTCIRTFTVEALGL